VQDRVSVLKIVTLFDRQETEQINSKKKK
jgi:hypothetical protein